MLDRVRIDVAEVVLICVIVIYISDGREVHTRNLILHDGEISEVRHKCIYHGCKRVCVVVFRSRAVEIKEFLIARAGLEKESRTIRSTCLEIDHKSNIVKHFPVVLPNGCHSHHSYFLSISEEDLHSLIPV